MSVRYLHLAIGQQPPPLAVSTPFRVVLIAMDAADDAWRTRIGQWLIDAGCLYFMAWGIGCERWHDSVDWALLESFDFEPIPVEREMLTTWHPDEPLEDVFWFAGNAALHPTVTMPDLLLLETGGGARPEKILDAYDRAQRSI